MINAVHSNVYHFMVFEFGLEKEKGMPQES